MASLFVASAFIPGLKLSNLTPISIQKVDSSSVKRKCNKVG